MEALAKLSSKTCPPKNAACTISAGSSAEQQQQRIINGMPQNAGKKQIDVSSTVRVRLKNVRDVPPDELIKTVGRLLDVAQDAGVDIGPNAAEMMRAMRYGHVRRIDACPCGFVVADLTELREKAYEKAVADARSRATRLAKLHQVKLGAALSVQEILVGGDKPTVRSRSIMPYHETQPQSLAEAEAPRTADQLLDLAPRAGAGQVAGAVCDRPAEPATAQK